MSKEFFIDWRFRVTGDFYENLSTLLTANQVDAVTNSGRLGLYLMSEENLEAVGYYIKQPKTEQNLSNNTVPWDGTWTGKNGINCKGDFLYNRIKQDYAIREYHKILWENDLAPYHYLIGHPIKDVIINQAMLIAASYTLSLDCIKTFVDTKGLMYIEGFNQAVRDIKIFSGCPVDYSLSMFENYFENCNASNIYNWSFKLTNDFYTNFAIISSANQTEIKHITGELGAYMMNEQQLELIGYYEKKINAGDEGLKFNNDWSGKWLGKNNITTIKDFLYNRFIQEQAIREYHKILWENDLADYQQCIGKEMEGIKITKPMLLAAAHVIGTDKLLSFLDSNGKDYKDMFEMNLRNFEAISDCDVDFTIEGLPSKFVQEEQIITADNNVRNPLEAILEQDNIDGHTLIKSNSESNDEKMLANIIEHIDIAHEENHYQDTNVDVAGDDLEYFDAQR